ncbi:VOC family protein [Terribacillus halophilus]|jgi:catechol 2,3-dioxygenase-like lactoylglutathione lyase family enzyme|uniref:VOC family protein n=1 Tax=Terribacillus halophilus TaxID=361279 RepID=UPI000985A8FB|nr:VOC family protein [Terribacillus halophilus]
MWKLLQCQAIYTENIDQSIAFYESMGLSKAWDTFQDEEHRWRLAGMKFPNGETELVLKDNPNLAFAETEIVVDDVHAVFTHLAQNTDIKWIRKPFPNALGGHVAVMQAPDNNVFVLVGN